MSAHVCVCYDTYASSILKKTYYIFQLCPDGVWSFWTLSSIFTGA